jgi:hypothetical protein
VYPVTDSVTYRATPIHQLWVVALGKGAPLPAPQGHFLRGASHALIWRIGVALNVTESVMVYASEPPRAPRLIRKGLDVKVIREERFYRRPVHVARDVFLTLCVVIAALFWEARSCLLSGYRFCWWFALIFNKLHPVTICMVYSRDTCRNTNTGPKLIDRGRR